MRKLGLSPWFATQITGLQLVGLKITYYTISPSYTKERLALAYLNRLWLVASERLSRTIPSDRLERQSFSAELSIDDKPTTSQCACAPEILPRNYTIRLARSTVTSTKQYNFKTLHLVTRVLPVYQTFNLMTVFQAGPRNSLYEYNEDQCSYQRNKRTRKVFRYPRTFSKQREQRSYYSNNENQKTH